MPSLKDLKTRISSVKNTQKITKAMKMVAAAKLRRAREAAEASRPYSERMERMVTLLASSVNGSEAPLLLGGTGKEEKHLIIVATADRGLCGGFNGSIIKSAKEKIRTLQAQGKQVGIFYVGRKGHDVLKREYSSLTVGKIFDATKKTITYDLAEEVAAEMLAKIGGEDGWDVLHVVYNQFVTVISQTVTWQQLVPLVIPEQEEGEETQPFEFEPGEAEILADLLPKNITMQIFSALLDNAASEQGARMSAMDNATRNAGDMIKKLTLQYNRTRQAAITKELIEIISGAEAI